MIKRYSTNELNKIWNDESKFQSWLDVEILVAEAYSIVEPKIKASEITKLKENAKINIARILELEHETKHDVIAFTRQISETLGEEKKWMHYGITSTDLVDTAQSIRLKKVNAILTDAIYSLKNTIKDMAIKYKNTYQIGRTHGIHAEVTTFGYKLALWYDELNRISESFESASKNIEVAIISGAVGNYANIPISVQEYVAKKLGLTSSKISSQTLQRDRHASYLFQISLIGSSLDKFATELRHLQRTEVGEVHEGFGEKQKGSSAMPHKKNPISSENISGLARVLRGYSSSAMENIALWHERDISHSSVERIILPDATTLLHYMLTRFQKTLTNLIVDENKMQKNIFMTNGIVFSQRAMLQLIKDKDMSREEAYDIIQPIAMFASSNNVDFATELVKRNIFSQAQADQLYDLSYYSKNIDAIFKNLKI